MTVELRNAMREAEMFLASYDAAMEDPGQNPAVVAQQDAMPLAESLRAVLAALSTPPADDVREALDAGLSVPMPNTQHHVWERLIEFSQAYRAEHEFPPNEAARTRFLFTAFEVRPRGTVTESERLEYTVAAISDNGAITSLSGESTVVRDHLRGDLELYRQQQVEAGCDPERIIIAQRPIPKWARS